MRKMSNNLPPVAAGPLAALREDELVVHAQAGDLGAFDELVRRHYDKAYRLARYLCDGHAEDAEDTFQNALIKAYQHLAAFRGEAQFASWLTRIAINECRMHWRRHGRERDWVRLDERVEGEETSMPLDVGNSSEDPEEEYARREFQSILQRCLSSLPDLDRAAFVLSEIDGLSNQEIAARLGLSPAAVKSRVFRARRRLQRHLSEKFCRGQQCYWPATMMVVPKNGAEKMEEVCSLSS